MRFLLFIGIILLFSCNSTNVAGGSATVENGFIHVSVTVAQQAIQSRVKLTPADFDPLIDDSSLIRMMSSTSSGIARFDSVPKGEYTVTILDDSLGVFINSVEINQSVNAQLVSLGSIVLPVNSNTDARLIGSPFIGTFNSEASQMLFDSIPKGLYSTMLIGDSLSVDSVVVQSGKTTVVDTQFLSVYAWSDLPPEIDSVLSIEKGAYGIYFGTNQAGIWSKTSGYNRIFEGTSSHLDFPVRQIRSSGEYIPAVQGELMIITTDNGTLLVENDTGVTEIEALMLVDQIGSKASHSYVNSSKNGYGFLAYDTICYWYEPTLGFVWNPIAKQGVTTAVGDLSTLYLGNERGVLEKLTNEDTVSFPIDETKIDALLFKGGDTIMISTQLGVYEWYNGVSKQLLSTTNITKKMMKDARNRIWGTYGSHGLFCIDGNDTYTYESIAGGAYEVIDFAVDDTTIYIASGESGILSIDLR